MLWVSPPKAVTGKFEMSVTLTWAARDASGRTVWMKESKGTVQGRQGFGPVFTTLPKALKKSYDEAMKDAVKQSAIDMASAPEFHNFSQSPSLEELQKETEAQISKLASYKAGTTTLDEFYADNWNAGDPFLMKLALLAKRSPARTTLLNSTCACCLANHKPMGDRAQNSLAALSALITKPLSPLENSTRELGLTGSPSARSDDTFQNQGIQFSSTIISSRLISNGKVNFDGEINVASDDNRGTRLPATEITVTQHS